MHRCAARDPATRSALFSSSHLTEPPTKSPRDFAGDPGSPRDFAGTPASPIPSGMASSTLHLRYPAATRGEQHRSVPSSEENRPCSTSCTPRVSWVLLRWHDLFTPLGLSERERTELGAVDRLPGRHRPVAAVPALRQAGALPAQHAGDAAADAEACARSTRTTGRASSGQMMALQQEEGFNPLAGCLPMLLQIPIFISLFHVLRHLSNSVGLCRAAVQPTPTAARLYSFTHGRDLPGRPGASCSAPRWPRSLARLRDTITSPGSAAISPRTRW